LIYDEAPDLYDAHYQSYRDDVPFYLRLADDVGGPVLELGAGTGRVTEALARSGHHVVAVDAAPAMLERARERLAAAGVADRARLVEADMRSLELGERFPLVVAPFNALMHAYTLDDQDRVLEGVLRHLEDGGVFAFDLYVPRFGPQGVVRVEPELGASLSAGPGERHDVFLVQEVDEVAQVATTTYFHDRVGEGGVVSRRVTVLRQRYYTRFEVERLCRAHGLRLEVYGGFDRSRYGAASAVMACLARRAPAAANR
jgi:SAM-dependent methyltransferase